MFAEKHSLSSYAQRDSLLWTIRGGYARGYPVAYPGEGPGGPASLTFEKTERPEGPKKKFGDRSPSPLFKVLDDRAPPWIRLCQWICVLIMCTTCLVPVRRLPRPSRSMHFSDVSKINRLKDSLRPRDLKHIGCAQ